MKTPLQIVFVEWKDAISRDNWEGIGIDLLPQTIYSVGFLLKKTQTHITIALSHDIGNDSVSNTLTVPIGMVEKISSVSVRRKK